MVQLLCLTNLEVNLLGIARVLLMDGAFTSLPTRAMPRGLSQKMEE